MAGSGGVPTRHAVAVGLSVVILQLLQAVKPHKAVLALLLHAQEVLPPEVFCEVVSSSKVALGSMAETQLAGEVVVVHMLPQLLSAEEVLVAEAAEGVGGGQVGLQLLLTAKQGQLQRKGALSIQTDATHVAVMLRGHMLGQGNSGGEGPMSMGVTDAAGSSSNALKVGMQVASRGGALRRGPP